AAARALEPMLAPETAVLPAMNGVPWWFLREGGGSLPSTALTTADADGSIARAIPLRHVVGCVVHASAHVSAPGRVVHQAGNTLIIGEPAEKKSHRVAALAGVFADAGLDIVQSQKLRRDIWYKLWGNMTMNPISAMVRATPDTILDADLVRAIIPRTMEAASATGRHIGRDSAASM